MMCATGLPCSTRTVDRHAATLDAQRLGLEQLALGVHRGLDDRRLADDADRTAHHRDELETLAPVDRPLHRPVERAARDRGIGDPHEDSAVHDDSLRASSLPREAEARAEGPGMCQPRGLLREGASPKGLAPKADTVAAPSPRMPLRRACACRGLLGPRREERVVGVADLGEGESPRGQHRELARALAPIAQLGDVLHAQPPLPHRDARPHERAHHAVAERVGLARSRSARRRHRGASRTRAACGSSCPPRAACSRRRSRAGR